MEEDRAGRSLEMIAPRTLRGTRGGNGGEEGRSTEGDVSKRTNKKIEQNCTDSVEV